MNLHHIARKLLPKATRDRIFSRSSAYLNRLGFIHQANAGPVDFRNTDIEPDDAMRRAAGIPFLIDIPIEHLRNVGPVTGVCYFSCAEGSGNPFLETILQYLSEKAINYSHSALRLYYESFRPSSIAEALGVDDDGKLHPLLHQSPLLTFPPWAHPPIEDHEAHLRRRQENIGIECRAAGQKLDYTDGSTGFGPVTEARGRFEIDRLVAITDSISANGYHISGSIGGIQVNTLRAGQEFRFMCYNGHHRTSALAALGHDSIPAFPLPSIVDRSDVLEWPGVKASVFTPDQALQVFDALFEGQPPAAASRWWQDLTLRGS